MKPQQNLKKLLRRIVGKTRSPIPVVRFEFYDSPWGVWICEDLIHLKCLSESVSYTLFFEGKKKKWTRRPDEFLCNKLFDELKKIPKGAFVVHRIEDF